MMPTWLPIVILVVQFVNLSIGTNNAAYPGPPMGWSSYGKFRCEKDCVKYPDRCIGEKLINRTANALVSKGLRDLGYRTMILDGCWETGRDSKSLKYQISASQFPSGMMKVVSDVHKHCLNFGLSFADECKDTRFTSVDAQHAHELDLDMLMHHSCSYDSMGRFHKSLVQYNKTMAVSCVGSWLSGELQNKGANMNWTTIQNSCTTWRLTDWPNDSWNSILAVIRTWAKYNSILREKSGPGHWVDLIALVVHKSELTYAEKRTNMGMWCLMSSPIFFSEDLDKMDNFTYQLLINKRLIAIDQDPSLPPKYLGTVNGIQIWVRHLSTTITWAVAFVNENNKPQSLDRTLSQLLAGITDAKKYKFSVTDIFTGVVREVVTWEQKIKITVQAHDTEMYFVHLECDPGKNKKSA